MEETSGIPAARPARGKSRHVVTLGARICLVLCNIGFVLAVVSYFLLGSDGALAVGLLLVGGTVAITFGAIACFIMLIHLMERVAYPSRK